MNAPENPIRSVRPWYSLSVRWWMLIAFLVVFNLVSFALPGAMCRVILFLDLRLWPSSVFVILAVALVGSMIWWQRSSKTGCSGPVLKILAFALIFALQMAAHATEPMEKKILLLEEAKRVAERDIRKAAKSESEVNPQGGYNANVNVIDCFAAMEYRYTGGRYVDEPIRFRLLTPNTIQAGRTYPLILWFHGKGESGEDNSRQLSHVQSTIRFLAGKEKLDFFLLATQCPSDNPYWDVSLSSEGKGDAPLTIAHEIFETVLNEYPIDRNRLGVFGLCSGANAAWHYAGLHPGRFASLVVCSSTPGAEKPESFVQTAVWAFNNEDDTAPFESVERFLDAINDTGGNACLTLRPSGGHDAWTRALSEDEVLNWMLFQSLDQPGPPQGSICYRRTTTELFFLFWLPALLVVTLSGILLTRRRRPDET